jgi:hypothetical protein
VNLFRAAVCGVSALLLAGGYWASLTSFFASQSPEARDATEKYIEALDASPVPWLALGIVVACAVLAALPQEEEQA